MTLMINDMTWFAYVGAGALCGVVFFKKNEDHVAFGLVGKRNCRGNSKSPRQYQVLRLLGIRPC